MREKNPGWEPVPEHQYIRGVEPPEKLSKEHKETLALKVFKLLRDKPIVSGQVERIGVERAMDLIEKTKISKHLKQDGIYSDIGSGLGHIAEQVINTGYDKNVKLLPFDIEWTPQKKVRKRMGKEGVGDRALFMRADATQQPIADKSLDGTSVFFVFHHANRDIQQKIMNEIRRTVKDDGKLFFVEDVAEDEEEAKRVSVWDARVNAEPKDEPHYYRTREEWVSFMDENGFELIEEADFEDHGKKSEGTIRHKSYIMQRKKEI